MSQTEWSDVSDAMSELPDMLTAMREGQAAIKELRARLMALQTGAQSGALTASEYDARKKLLRMELLLMDFLIIEQQMKIVSLCRKCEQ